MKVIRYSDVDAFYARVEPYLLPREAEHNLSFGLLANVRSEPERFPEPFFAVVEEAGAVVLVALRTNIERGLILSLAAEPKAAPLLASYLFTAGMLIVGMTGPVDESRAFAETWSRLTGLASRVNVPLRNFKLEKVAPVSGVSGLLRRASDADYDTLVLWDMAFRREAFPNDEHHMDDVERAAQARLRSQTAGYYVWDDGGPVSFLGYGGPTPHGIRIGPVYTPPELRGHGYASACVAGASQALLDGGRSFCFLFTDARNPTSNHIYQQIGYRHICDMTEYAFGR